MLISLSVIHPSSNGKTTAVPVSHLDMLTNTSDKLQIKMQSFRNNKLKEFVPTHWCKNYFLESKLWSC